MTYNLNIQVYDTYTGTTLSGAIARVYYMNGSTEVNVEPSAEGIYPIPENTTAYIEYAKEGYMSSSGYRRVNTTEIWETKGLSPASVKGVFEYYYVDGTRRYGLSVYGDALLQHEENGEWITIETCTMGSGTSAYFRTECVAGDHYRVNSDGVSITTRQCHAIPPYEWTATETNHGYPDAYTALYTCDLIDTIFKPVTTDSKTGEALAPTSELFYYNLYGTWAQVSKNSYCGGYIVRHGNATTSTLYYKVIATLAGYDNYEQEFTYGNAGVQTRQVDIDVKLTRTIAYHIPVVDGKTDEPLTDYTITVSKDGETVEISTDGDFYTPWTDGMYTVKVEAEGYMTEEAEYTEYPEEIKMYEPAAPVTFTVTDGETAITPDSIGVKNHETQEEVEPDDGVYYLELRVQYDYIVRKDGYETATGSIVKTRPTPYTLEVTLEKIPVYAPLTVIVKDADTAEEITDATIIVKNENTHEEIDKSEDGKYYLLVDEYCYRAYVTKYGYAPAESTAIQPTDDTPITETVRLTARLEPFATADDLKSRTGIDYTAAELERIDVLLEDISNLIRSEGRKCDVDVDDLNAHDPIYRSILKTVTCDVTQRVLRQSQEGDAMSQESQSALGYSWSGTYAIPGGGIAMSLMRNEKDILGLNPQTIGVIDLC